jgi:hypothetical protein
MLGPSEKLCYESGLNLLSPDSMKHLRLEFAIKFERAMKSRVKTELTPEEHQQLEALFERGDVATAFKLLQDWLPEYEQLAREEKARIECEIKRDAHAILAIEDALGHLRATCGREMSALDGCSGMEPPLAD